MRRSVLIFSVTSVNRIPMSRSESKYSSYKTFCLPLFSGIASDHTARFYLRDDRIRKRRARDWGTSAFSPLLYYYQDNSVRCMFLSVFIIENMSCGITHELNLGLTITRSVMISRYEAKVFSKRVETYEHQASADQSENSVIDPGSPINTRGSERRENSFLRGPCARCVKLTVMFRNSLSRLGFR